jgi:predicted RNA-binding Zn ribbon-like protein
MQREVIDMTTPVRVRAKITPWDDPAFVGAFERARAEMDQSGCCDEGPKAAAEVQRRLREAGYPDARVEVLRTVQEALEHTSHWLVSRDA